MLSRSKQTGEVFTPIPLVAEMLKRLPRETWISKTITFLDNSAGDGNFLWAAKKLLMAGHGDERVILEDQLFAVEIMPDNVQHIHERLGHFVRKDSLWVPNPILDTKNFDEVDVAHSLPDGSTPPSRYFHHRNIVCADALKYDYSFGR